jgi:malonate transporter and related proteins
VSIAFPLLPDFAIILFGLALKRWFESGDSFWSGAERLIYYVLFPALLFTSTARAHIDFGAATPMLVAGVGATIAGMLLGALAKPLFRPDARIFAASFQCAFRFNTYIGLALISRLHGDAGLASMSLLLGVAIPLVNVVAVWSLARDSGNIWRELARNPLIIATLGGIAFSVLGFQLPDTGWQILGRLGGTALPLGLLAVGAALRLKGVGEHRDLIAWWLAVKLLAVPACAYAIASWLGLAPLSLHCAVLFAALPAATSAYILAVRMGADGSIVAAIISSGTLLAMLTLPLWLAIIGASGG